MSGRSTLFQAMLEARVDNGARTHRVSTGKPTAYAVQKIMRAAMSIAADESRANQSFDALLNLATRSAALAPLCLSNIVILGMKRFTPQGQEEQQSHAALAIETIRKAPAGLFKDAAQAIADLEQGDVLPVKHARRVKKKTLPKRLPEPGL